jgi:hypothetical protein
MLVWVLVALISLLLASGLALERLSLGFAALPGLAGATLSVLYVVLEGPAGLAWAAGAGRHCRLRPGVRSRRRPGVHRRM